MNLSDFIPSPQGSSALGSRSVDSAKRRSPRYNHFDRVWDNGRTIDIQHTRMLAGVKRRTTHSLL